MPIPLDDVERLVDLVAASRVTEVVVEEGDLRVVVRRGHPTWSVGASLTEVVSPHPSAEGATEHATIDPNQGTPSGVHAVTAPMVGVFRFADAVMHAGHTLAPGQAVGAIESMNLMNDVRADVGGEIIEVLIEDGAPVEYGQPLFLVQSS